MTAQIDVSDIQFGEMAIQEEDWELIHKFLVAKKVKEIVEIGSGTSTELFTRLGLDVFSIETDAAYARKFHDYHNVTTAIWNGREHMQFPSSIHVAFIDGPYLGKNREYSYINCVNNTSISWVICHDAQREDDGAWIEKHLDGWILYSDQTLRTKIFSRPNSSKRKMSV